jgi:hypothetical protein
MRRALSAVAAIALAGSGLLVTGGPAAARERSSAPPVVHVHGDGKVVTLSRHSVQAGRIRFTVDTTHKQNGSNITMFRPVGHVTVKQLLAEVDHVVSNDPKTAARGTRELNRDGRFYGLADVVVGTPAAVTESLRPGTYYLVDGGGNSKPSAFKVTTLRVLRSDDGDDNGDDSGRQASRHHATVLLTSADRFVAPRVLPAHGSVSVRNVADTIHFMSFAPVKRGTTDAQIQAFFDSGGNGQPPFALNGPSIGLDVLSPGRHALLSYKLPAGTYVLLCFIPDDKTGIPHAIMGMHKVVTLK